MLCGQELPWGCVLPWPIPLEDAVGPPTMIPVLPECPLLFGLLSLQNLPVQSLPLSFGFPSLRLFRLLLLLPFFALGVVSLSPSHECDASHENSPCHGQRTNKLLAVTPPN
jgi:hypothetical protein